MSTLLASRPLQCDLRPYVILEQGRLVRSDDPYPRLSATRLKRGL